MKRIINIISLITILVMGSMTAQVQRVSSVGEDVYPGIIRLKFSEETINGFSSLNINSASTPSPVFTTGVNSIDKVNRKSNVFTFKRVFPFSQKHEAKHRKHGLHLWYEVTFDDSQDIEAMMDSYVDIDGVELIKPVYRKVSEAATAKAIVISSVGVQSVSTSDAGTQSTDVDYPFDDPQLPLQWHYENYGELAGTADSDIDLFGAWLKETGNDSVIVAVMDEGVDYKHEDLADAMWVNEAEANGINGIDDDGNGFIDDVHGYNFYKDQGDIDPLSHGTHVAGTVAAVNNNGIGVSGVAGGDGEHKGARIMSCQIYGGDSGSGGTAAAYIYAADNGAVISQSSWSYTSSSYFEPEVQEAIDYFYEEAGDFEGSKIKGGVLFFSAGNNSSYGDYYPSAYEKVIGVTATGAFNSPSSYTNFHESFDIAAPGGDFDNDYSQVLSTLPDNNYGYMSGTSMATPHVSGVAALMISYSTDSEYTNADLYAKMLDMTTPFDYSLFGDTYYTRMGVGHLNALNSLLENSSIAPDRVDTFNITEVTHNRVSLEWIVPTDSDDVQPMSYTVGLSEVPFTANEFSQTEQFSLDYSGSVGDTVTANLSGLDPSQPYYIAVTAVDIWGNASPLSEILTFTTLSLPKFTVSDFKFQFMIDVNERLSADTTIIFTNSGEGMIEWASNIENNTSIFPDLIDSTKWFYTDTIESVNALVNASAAATDIVSKPVVPGTAVYTDYLANPVFIAAIYNDLDEDPTGVFGSYATEFTVIQATLFTVPLGSVFPLTHVQAWINVEDNSIPLKVEIRTGEDLLSSELAYQRYYFPDTTGLIDAIIPLERPIFMDETQDFWIVIEHPKDELLPIVTNTSYVGYGVSYASFDGGATWTDFTELTASSPQAIKVRAYSTGEDPSFTYLDPISGEIPGYSTSEVQLYVNAENLRDGEHTSFVNVYTNDETFISGAIDVSVLVSGHEGELIYEDDFHANTSYHGITNSITYHIENDGLGSIDILGFDFDSDDIHAAVDTAFTMLPTMTRDMEFLYTPATLGADHINMTIRTNQGDLAVIVRTNTIELSQVKLDYGADTLRFSLNKGEVKDFTFTIENVSDVEPLDFQIQSRREYDGDYAYSTLDSFDYVIFNDTSAWDDLTEYSDAMDYFFDTNVELGFRFPFYDRNFEQTTVYGLAYLAMGDHDDFPGNMPSEDVTRGLIATLGGNFSYGSGTSVAQAYYHSFGNRFVSQVDSIKPAGAVEEDGVGTVQSVLYKDGTIDMRYRDIDELDFSDAVIGIQDLWGKNALMIKSVEDSLFSLNDHDVIRITPRESASFLDKVSISEGKLLPGNTQEITVTINPDSSELISGTYLNKLKIFTNTVEGEVHIPIVLEVINGFDSLTVDTNLIVFDQTYTDFTYTDTLFITNHSGVTNDILSLESDLEGLSIRGELTPLAPHEIRRLLIDFVPVNGGDFDGSFLVKTTFEDIVVDVKSSTLIRPTFDLITNDYHFDLDQDKLTDTIVLKNTSTTTNLDFQFFGSSFVTAYIPQTDVALQKDVASSIYNEMDSAYRLSYSVEDDNTPFFYDDIANVGDRLSILRNGFIEYALDFEFYYFGEYYDTLWISKNGYVTVIEPTVSSDPITEAKFSVEDGVSGVIKPFYIQLDEVTSPYNGIFATQKDDHLIVQWDDVYSYDDFSPGVVSFQVALFEDGRIRFSYLDINDYLGYTNYGLESPNEEIVIDLGIEGPDIDAYGLLADSSSITLAPAVYGSLSPQATLKVPFLASPDFMLEGDYDQSLLLRTNSSDTDTIIPITISLAERTNVSVDTLVDFGEFYVADNGTYETQFTVYNGGRSDIKVKSIEDVNIEDFELFHENNDVVERYTRGDRELLTWDNLLPGQLTVYTIKTSVSELGTHEGEIYLTTNDNVTYKIKTILELVASPKISTSGKDTVINVMQTDVEQFSFTVGNAGADTLDYIIKGIYPGTKDAEDQLTSKPGAVFDSLAYSFNDESIANYSNLEGGSFYISTLFDAAEDSLLITSVAHYLNITNTDDYSMRLNIKEYPYDSIYPTLTPDSMGVTIYEEDYRYVDDRGKKWRYMNIPDGINFVPGKRYFVTYILPTNTLETSILPCETTFDTNALDRTFFGAGSVMYKAYAFSGDDLQASWIPKVRLLAGAHDDGFISLSLDGGRLGPNEEHNIQISVDASSTSSGLNEGIVMIQATNYSETLMFNVDLLTNAKPEFEFLPAPDTLVIQEKTPYVGSYLAFDPEGEEVTYTLLDSDGLDVVFTQSKTSPELAKISFDTGWEDQGLYDVVVQIEDPMGNTNLDTLVVEVTNYNRTPVLTYEDYIIINMAHGESFTMNMYDMFVDPDGDDLTFQIGNAYPEYYEMSLSGDHVLITPIEPGVGYVIFAADDGHVDGYAGYYYYVYVIDDASVAPQLDGVASDKLLEDVGYSELTVSPNPTSGLSNVYFKLENDSHVQIDLYDLQGHLLKNVINSYMDAGNRYVSTDLDELLPGVYFYRLTVGEQAGVNIKVVKQ